MFKFALSAALTLLVSQAGAAVVAVSSVGGAATGTSYATFDLLPLGTAGGVDGDITVSIITNGEVVQGASSGVYAAPVLSGFNGTGFGNPAGVDTTHYLTSGSTGSAALAEVKLTFSAPKSYMGLLWGSVDLYNTLTFYDAANAVVGTVVGADVCGLCAGDQGTAGTLYVNINADTPFSYVVATSTQFAFEFDNVAYDAGNQVNPPVPLPAAVWLFGSALVGLGVLSRRRRKAPSVSAA